MKSVNKLRIATVLGLMTACGSNALFGGNGASTSGGADTEAKFWNLVPQRIEFHQVSLNPLRWSEHPERGGFSIQSLWIKPASENQPLDSGWGFRIEYLSRPNQDIRATQNEFPFFSLSPLLPQTSDSYRWRADGDTPEIFLRLLWSESGSATPAVQLSFQSPSLVQWNETYRQFSAQLAEIALPLVRQIDLRDPRTAVEWVRFLRWLSYAPATLIQFPAIGNSAAPGDPAGEESFDHFAQTTQPYFSIPVEPGRIVAHWSSTVLENYAHEITRLINLIDPPTEPRQPDCNPSNLRALTVQVEKFRSLNQQAQNPLWEELERQSAPHYIDAPRGVPVESIGRNAFDPPRSHDDLRLRMDDRLRLIQFLCPSSTSPNEFGDALGLQPPLRTQDEGHQ